MRRVVVPAITLVVGLIVGGGLGFLAQGQQLDFRGPAPVPAATPPAVHPIVADTLLAWTPGGLPPGFGAAVAKVRGVDRVVSVASGVAWLDRSFSAAGVQVDRPPAGLAIPLEVAAAEPRAYAPFLAPGDQSLLAALANGQAVLGAAGARLRRLGPGAVLQFGGVKLTVAGILPDAEIGAHEVFVSKRTARRLGVTVDRYLLIDPAPGASRTRITRGIHRALPPGKLVQIRGPGETPYFRMGDAVLPQITVKELFGEFAARPTAGGYIFIDPAWVRAHIVTTALPILGRVTCNRALVPQLRGALQELQSEGLASLIDLSQFAGSFSPRFLNRIPNSSISHHAWGIAVDINARSNPYGHTPHQDPRLVAAFERWGFTWGGTWIVPDAMHFEFLRFPSTG